VTTRLRKMVEALCPEAVGRRRAEEVSALATAELLQLVPLDPPTESHQALVQVRWRVLPNRVRFSRRGSQGCRVVLGNTRQRCPALMGETWI
jgi:hypothetical protein